MAVLKASGISNLDEKDLQILLLLNDPSFLPEVCKDYKGQRKEESCTKEERCDKLHICGFFARGQCRYSGCSRSHNLLDSNSIRLLQARGLGNEICQNIQLMRTHQCSEAQKEFRKNNSKGRSQSTTNINSSHTPQKPDVPLLEHSFSSLYSLGAPYSIFSNSEPSNRSLQTNKPNVHMPVGFQYPPSLLTLRLPPQLTKPQMPLGPSASLAVSSTEHREKSVPHLVTSPITGASHADKPARKMPVGTSSFPTASSGPQQSTSSISGAPQTNKLAGHAQVGLLPTPILSYVPHLAASPLFCAPMTNKQVVQLPAGPPFTTGSKSKHPETLPYTQDQPQKKTTNTPVSASVSNISTLPAQGILSQTSSLVKPPMVMGIETTTAAKASQQHVSSVASTLKDLGDPNEICLHHIWKFCKKQNKCVQMHYYLPYRWQILEVTGEWKDLSSMEEIEKAYCNPTNMSSTYHNIDFQKMTSSFSEVRRLSTASSVTKPSNYILTTNWVWYWKDEYRQWIEYGKQGGKEAAMITSTDLENIYLTDKSGALQFEAGCQTYEINFKDMIQSNVVYGTEKEVLRRPTFVSQEDVGKLKASGNASQGTTSSISPPAYWDRKALPRLGYELLEVQRSTSEFQDIETEFEKTMTGYSLEKIIRIQNPSLWEAYQMKKDLMKKMNRGREVLEKKLFHGTNDSDVDTVCRENFDWRNYGVQSHCYGYGSYFSRDANYCCQSCHTSGKYIFLARILVGDFVQGQDSYVRPPAKSSHHRLAYDSCVDNESNPSIYVIFDKLQIYPEYLLQYRKNKAPSNVQDYAAFTAQYNAPSNVQDYARAKVQGTTQSNAQGHVSVKVQDSSTAHKEKDKKCCIS